MTARPDETRVLLAQLSPKPGDADANAARAAELVTAHPTAHLAVFPELYLGGYFDGLKHGIGVADDPAMKHIAEAAKATATAVIVGVAAETPEGRTSAAACLDESGDLVAVVNKVCPFAGESRHIVGADVGEPVALAGHRLGVVVCFDVEFPEISRLHALAGATMLVTVSANPDPYGDVHRVHVRARALENELPHVYVNRVGADDQLTFPGGSCVVDAHGQVRAEVPAGEQVLMYDASQSPEAFPDPLDYVAIASTRWWGQRSDPRAQ